MTQENLPVLLEIQYLAPVQYYSKFLLHPAVVIEQHENYTKGSFRNRCIISMSDGLHQLSIPLQKGKNQQSPVREVKIDYAQNWQQQHWRSIKTAYGSAPFFEFYEDRLILFYEKKYDFLFDYCLEIQALILKLIKISPDIKFTDTFQKNPPNIIDLRNCISPKNYSKATDFDPCFYPKHYSQIFEDRLGFLANLSILDLLFCAGPEAKFTLKQSIIK